MLQGVYSNRLTSNTASFHEESRVVDTMFTRDPMCEGKNDDLEGMELRGGFTQEGHDDYAPDIMLGFKRLGLTAVDPPRSILSNVTGFVVKGGVTAVLGPSSSGKSVLMEALTGRLPSVHCTGEVTFCGKRIDPQEREHSFGFVSQNDNLIGDLTVRETFEVAARLRNVGGSDQAAKDAEEVIQGLGLGRVGDNVVGTILRRGLSGGEKRRVTVGQELVVRQAMAFLDEPTSGLDGTAAYDVIKTIKGVAARSEGNFSVMLSIHQPNRRILELFDHILLLGRGGSLFFGTLEEAVLHLTQIGHPPPPSQVPTDFFLQVTDNSFGSGKIGATNFRQAYATSRICERHTQIIEHGAAQYLDTASFGIEYAMPTFPGTGFWIQFWTLLWRDSVLAVRDPTLYYLQLALHVLYGVLIGATFWDTPTRLDDTVAQMASSCIWVIMLQSYIHVFKVFYQSNANNRFHHERCNGSYGVMAFFFSETLVAALAQLLWIPGVTIAFAMIGYPWEAFLFSILTATLAALAAESMINLLTKFNHHTSQAIVASQAVLVTLTVFAGGIFLPVDEVPAYWDWLKELSLFSHASQALLAAVFEHLEFDCPVESIDSANKECITLQHTYACDAAFDADSSICTSKGSTVMEILSGGIDGDKWDFLGYLAVLYASFRLGVLLLYRWPVDKIVDSVRSCLASPLVKKSLEQEAAIEILQGEVTKLKGAGRHRDEPRRRALIQPPRPEVEVPLLTKKSLGSTGSSEGPLSRRFSRRGSKSWVANARLVFRNLVVDLPKKGNVLIDDVTGMAKGGRVLALMGPSGAGKTTLLNALSGRATYARVVGEVTLNGRGLTSDDLDYVPQFDDLNEYFTPRELLTYINTLKVIPSSSVKEAPVPELLRILGLIGKADVLTSSLSGGERKRLSIGIGMIAAPAVLFLDEPTTGLDSAAAYSVVKYINKLASQTGVVCITTIHQPAAETFGLLEDLMLLERGRLAFFGNTSRAITFFDSVGGSCPANVNPADFYLDLVSKPPPQKSGVNDTKKTWKSLYENSDFRTTPQVPSKGCKNWGSFKDLELVESVPSGSFSETLPTMRITPRPDTVSRFKTLVWHLFKYYWRIPGVYWLRILELVFIGVFIGTMFLRLERSEISQTTAAAFFNIWCVLFVVVAAVPAFAVDRRTALQEMLNGAYGPAIYCLSQFIASIPYIMLSAFVYQSVFHWLVGLNDDVEAYVYSAFSSAGMLFMMEAIMLVVVEGLQNAMLACTFSMVILGALFLYTGFFVKISDMPITVRWISWITPTRHLPATVFVDPADTTWTILDDPQGELRYGFQGYLYSIFHGQDFETNLGTVSGDDILQGQYDQDSDVNQWVDLLVMVAWIVFLRVWHFLVIYTGILPYRNAMATTDSSSTGGSR